MRHFVSRALLTFAVLASAAACASGGGGGGVALGGDTGGRYLVLIPPLEGPSGDRVANELRTLVTGMATHAAIADRDVRRAMSDYDLTELDEISTRQLAQVIRARIVSWGEVRQDGAGLAADMKFVDTASGDEIQVDGTGATPQELATSIFASFTASMEGISQASYCNDYLSSDQFDRALETCDAALAIVPTSTSALYGRATALLNLDREEEALAAYERLLEIDPTHSDALLGAGLAASRLDRSEQAMGYYNRYLEINPANIQVRMTVANDIAQTGDHVSAFRVLEPAITEHPDNTDFQRYLFSIATAAGQRLREQGDSVVARQVFTAAYNAYEAGYGSGDAEVDASILQNVVAVTSALGRTDDALRLARGATDRHPNDARLLSTYATALRDAGRTDEEIRVLTRLAEAEPDNETVYIRRAQAYMRAGQRQQAMGDLQRAAQRGDRQTVATVLYNMAAEVAREQNWTEAASILSSAHEYSAGDVRSNVEYLWGLALLQQAAGIARGNTSGNVQQFERSLDLARRSLQLLRATRNPAAAQYIPNAEQLIANQEALLQSIRR